MLEKPTTSEYWVSNKFSFFFKDIKPSYAEFKTYLYKLGSAVWVYFKLGLKALRIVFLIFLILGILISLTVRSEKNWTYIHSFEKAPISPSLYKELVADQIYQVMKFPNRKPIDVRKAYLIAGFPGTKETESPINDTNVNLKLRTTPKIVLKHYQSRLENFNRFKASKKYLPDYSTETNLFIINFLDSGNFLKEATKYLKNIATITYIIKPKLVITYYYLKAGDLAFQKYFDLSKNTIGRELRIKSLLKETNIDITNNLELLEAKRIVQNSKIFESDREEIIGFLNQKIQKKNILLYYSKLTVFLSKYNLILVTSPWFETVSLFPAAKTTSIVEYYRREYTNFDTLANNPYLNYSSLIESKIQPLVLN